jgi:hypothetical protein
VPVRVPLGGRAEQSTGMLWPSGVDARSPSDVAFVDRPTVITVVMPSGRAWSHLMDQASFRQQDGRIDLVVLTPFVSRQTFDSLVAFIESTTRELGVEHSPTVVERLADWKKSPPQRDIFKRLIIGTCAEHGLSVEFDVRPDPLVPGWSLTMDFMLNDYCFERGEDKVINWKK